MSLHYEVTGYDRRTSRLAVSCGVPSRRVPLIRRLAGVPETDDGFGSYPLTESQAKEILTALETAQDLRDRDFFLEPYSEDAQHVGG